MEEPVFAVKLRKTGTRVPVVLSPGETERLFGALERSESKAVRAGESEEAGESDGTGGAAPDSATEKEPAAADGEAGADAPGTKKGPARYALVARLQYGAGLRLSEVVRLRVKDIDLERGTVTVRQGKGDKDCRGCRPRQPRPAGCPWQADSRPAGTLGCQTVLPRSLREELAAQIERAREVWKTDREAGLAGIYLPGALARKFRHAAESFEWFYLFPASQTSIDPESGIRRRHHLHGKVYNEAIRRAAMAAGIEKRVTSHALRH